MGKDKTKIHEWLCPGDVSGRFLMLPPELYQSPQWQALKPAARDFYVFLNVYRETEQQRSCLHKVLTAYNSALNIGLTDFDITNEARPGKHTKYNSGYFVCPEEHFEEYGYKKSYVKDLKKQLIDNGFMRIAYSGIGRVQGFKNNITVYQFTRNWQQ